MLILILYNIWHGLQKVQIAMYKSILGDATDLQTIINSNFECEFDVRFTNSHNSFISSYSKYDFNSLKRMLQFSNSKYMHRPHQLVPLFTIADKQMYEEGAGLGSQTIQDGANLNKINKISQLLQKYAQDDEEMINQQLNNMKLGDKSKNNGGTHNHSGPRNQFIKKLISAMQQINTIKINQIENQQMKIIENGKILITHCLAANPFFQQLLRQLHLMKKQIQFSTILIQILSPLLTQLKLSFQNSMSKLYLNNEKEQEIYKTIYYLLLLQCRQQLWKVMHKINQQQLFKLVNQYDDMFINSTKSVSQYFRRVHEWANKGQSKYCKLIEEYLTFTSTSLPHSQITHFQHFSLFYLLNNFVKGLSVKIDNQNESDKFTYRIANDFKQKRKIVLEQLSMKTLQWNLLALKLLDYDGGFKGLKVYEQKLLFKLVICCEQQALNKLLSFFKLNTIQQANGNVEHLLKSLAKKKYNYELVLECLPLLNNKQRISVLVSNQYLIQSIGDWSDLTIVKLLPKPQRNQLITQSISQSIEMYKNATCFLNIGIEGELFSFNIQILLQCLIHILLNNQCIDEKDKSKFYGMLSSFRGDFTLTSQYQFKMLILEMLFEIYIIQQSIISEDYKQLGLSLKLNLQQICQEQLETLHYSNRMTESSRRQGFPREMHNKLSIVKISEAQFISKVCQLPEYQHFYLLYLSSLGSAICKILQIKRKIINKIKLQIWIQSLTYKITTALHESKGQFFDMLKNLKQSCLTEIQQSSV